MFWVRDGCDRKVEMSVSKAGVAGVADEADRRPLFDLHPFSDAVGSSLQMCVVQNEFPIGCQLVDRDTTTLAVKEFEDLAIRRRDDRRSPWSHDVDRIVNSTFRSCRGESVDKLIGSDPGDRNDQSGSTLRQRRRCWYCNVRIYFFGIHEFLRNRKRRRN